LRFTFCFGIIGTIFIGCVNNPQPDESYALSFPFETGKKWVYDYVIKFNDSTIDSTVMFSAITSQKTNQSGFPVFELKDSIAFGGISSYDYYEKRPDGIYLYASTPGGIHALWKSKAMQPEVQFKDPPVLLAPFSFKQGDEWVYDSLVDSTYNMRTALRRIFQGMQKVETKMGILDCYKFETSRYINEKRFHYFYSGIGLVMKEEIIDSLGFVSADSSNMIVVVSYGKCIRRNTLISFE
jgi:hypothetical protein